MTQRSCLLAFNLTAALFLISAPCTIADNVVAYYPVTRTGIAYTYGIFGYTPANGSFTSLVGDQIIGASLTIDYTPAPDEDINNLRIDMAVPTDAAEQFFGVTGADFTLIAPGRYRYELTTDLFNGTIQAGRFGLETYSLVDGGAIGTQGQYLEGSGFRYTVAQVPEPSTWGWLGLGALGAAVATRRKRQILA